ncbi:MFS transporter [Actinoplanes sp. NBRC 103695]|uniref:MFS transporter n=1 Tax=Actinoplanes sp. NBRC 103695 TaxID=3032202 RepID=UPI0025541B52|nr:MFS transporter [Actinoplanes sp. NBRC 103695]
MMRLVDRALPPRLGVPFRWLLGSSWSTNLGDGIAAAAGPLLVAALTDEPFLVSMAALLRWAPPMVFGLYAGVLSDRHDRRRIVLVANAVRLLVLAGLVAALATDRLTVAGALAGLGLLATAEVFADNTTATLTPMLVPRADLAIANARVQTGFLTLNQLAGPPIGAALFAAGYVWPFVAETILVCAGLLLLSRLVLPPATAPNRERGVLRDIREGFAWTIRHAAVRTLVLTILIFNVTFGAAWSVLVLYASERLGLGALGFGLLTTVSAVGGLLGTGLYGWITARVSLGNVMRAGLIIETLTHLALAVTTAAPVALAIFFVFGAHAFIWGTTSVTVRQRAVPDALQGRVTSVNTISVYGGLVAGSAVGGVLATHFGVTAPFWFAFAGSAVFVVLLWRSLTSIAHADSDAATAS